MNLNFFFVVGHLDDTVDLPQLMATCSFIYNSNSQSNILTTCIHLINDRQMMYTKLHIIVLERDMILDPFCRSLFLLGFCFVE